MSAALSAWAAPKGLTISDSWMRVVIPSRPAAGYFTLSNETGKEHALVGASSPACGTLMLHRCIYKNGQDQMVMAREIPVPAHGTIKFAPGSYHLMCMKPSKDMAPGHSVPVTLKFKDGSTAMADFAVRGPTGK